MAKYELDTRDKDGDEVEETMDGGTSSRLQSARMKFQAAVDHAADYKSEAHRCLRFYHNSEGTGQWDHDDLSYLVEQGRPAFSFNIIAPKMDTFLGFYEDAQRTPIVAPSGAEDKLVADIIGMVSDQILKKTKYEDKSARQLKTGTAAGECCLQIEVEPSPKGNGWIKVNLHRVMPFEVSWDASSIEPDRSDAGCVFWDRWMRKDEFNDEYPDHKGEFNQVAGVGDPWSGVEQKGYGEEGDRIYAQSDYDGESSMGRYYYDRNEGKIRVIHYEYKCYVDRYTVTNDETGESREIDEDKVEQVQTAIEMGAKYSIKKDTVERVKVMEFIGSTILEEYDSPGPFEGFSIIPFTYAMDEETGTPYGMIRNLIDPQQELNKSKSMAIEHVAQSITTGTIAEEGAITNDEQYTDAVRTPGSVSYVKEGALSEGRVRDRVTSPPNSAVMERADSAMTLMNEISGMPSTANITPGEAAQAGITVAIRYNKAKQSVSQPFNNFEGAQICLYEKIVDIIVRAMPDDQIESIVASDTYMVGNGMVVKLQQDESGSGQMVPVQRANIREVRNMEHNVELDYGTENSTLRMIEYDNLSRLNADGVPVDPDVLVELATSSRSMRERLKAYVNNTIASQSKEQKRITELEERIREQDIKLKIRQMNQITGVEMAGTMEDKRHNIATEKLQSEKQNMDAATNFAKIWEQADEAEKDRLVMWHKVMKERSPQGVNA